jgi:hypothetical protein
MTRLTFCFSPRDTTDFDVCAGPARPPAPPAREDRPAAEPAAAAPRATEAPRPAEG